MSRYDYQSRIQKQRPWKVHPIWRGIGCLLIIMIPVMSYAGAVLLVRENMQQGWIPMPYELARPVTIPLVGAVSYLYAYLLAAGVLAVLGFASVTVIYSLMYSRMGPPRFGPTDAPSEEHRRRRRR